MTAYDWHTPTYDLLLALTRMNSITGTTGETVTSAQIWELLAAWPYFAAHPDLLRQERTHADTHDRSVVYALVRGRSTRTVILTGHYDVVEVSDYGTLAGLAFDPEALRPALIQDLQQAQGSTVDALALQDLESGAFLPGRGALDMKSGLAAGLAVLARQAAEQANELSVLFVAVPDEEVTSQGARSAVRHLPTLAAEWGITPIATINLDVEGDPDNTGRGQAIFLGSIGKLLPAVYFVGRQTHVGAAYEGVNAALLAAELTRLVECNPTLGDQEAIDGELAAPPITLYQQDMRTIYNVTTPSQAWCAYNVLTASRSAADVLAQFADLARQAMHSALDLLRARAAVHGALRGAMQPFPAWEPRVFTYAELAELAAARGGDAAIARVQRYAERLAADASNDLLTISRELVSELVREAGLEGPAAVVCMASLYYPPVALGAGARDHALRAAVSAAAAAIGARHKIRIQLRPYFPGISDMSFFGGRESDAALATLAANTPAWGTRLVVDYAAASALNAPVVNIGPWGRDYHRRTERVHVQYACTVVPELLWDVIGRL